MFPHDYNVKIVPIGMEGTSVKYDTSLPDLVTAVDTGVRIAKLFRSEEVRCEILSPCGGTYIFTAMVNDAVNITRDLVEIEIHLYEDFLKRKSEIKEDEINEKIENLKKYVSSAIDAISSYMRD